MELDGAGFRALVLRRDGKCSHCSIELTAGSKALWNPSERIIWCLAHSVLELESTNQKPDKESQESENPESMAYNKGKAGSSAQAKHDHLVQAREKRVTTKFPRMGKLLLTVFDEPQSTKAWAIGAEGEVAIGRKLDSLAEKYKFFVLHDRGIPKSRANIDHIAITQSGIIVIDAKKYKGTIQIKDKSGLFSAPDPQLWVGQRNCMKLVSGMKHQVEIVKVILEKENIEIPVIGVLAFYDATWDTYKFMRKQEVIDGVLINSKGIEPILARPGTVSTEQMEQVTKVLATQLKPAIDS